MRHRVLGLCVGFARQPGYTGIVLWTHESPAVAFGQAVVDQTWERDL